MRIGIECTSCADRLGRRHYRLAPYFRGTATQRMYSIAVIGIVAGFAALLWLGMVMTDIRQQDSAMIEVTPKYGVMR